MTVHSELKTALNLPLMPNNGWYTCYYFDIAHFHYFTNRTHLTAETQSEVSDNHQTTEKSRFDLPDIKLCSEPDESTG